MKYYKLENVYKLSPDIPAVPFTYSATYSRQSVKNYYT